MSHARVDARSLTMHRAIAEKLRERPELIGIAHENLARWTAGPLDEVLAVIVEDSERMTAMRQCSPFAGVLDARERWAIYDEFAAPEKK